MIHPSELKAELVRVGVFFHQDARANFISKDKDGLSRSTTTPIGSRTADPADEVDGFDRPIWGFWDPLRRSEVRYQWTSRRKRVQHTTC